MPFKRALELLGWPDVGQQRIRVFDWEVRRLVAVNAAGGCSTAAAADVRMAYRKEVFRWKRLAGGVVSGAELYTRSQMMLQAWTDGLVVS